MWWGGTEIQQLYVARGRCGLRQSDGSCQWLDGPLNVEGLTLALREGGASRRLGRPRNGLRVWLSGFHARPFLMAKVDGVTSHVELQALARAQVAEATGLDEACRLWLQEPPAAGDTLVVAMPEALLAALQSAVHQSGMKLRSVRPWWAGALDEQLERGESPCIFVAEEHDAYTLLATEEGAWTVAETSLPAADPLQVDDWVRRLAVGMSAAVDQVARVKAVPQSIGGAGFWPALATGSHR